MNLDYVMVDSGAQVCVCPDDYAPDIPLQRDEYDLPELRTVNGAPIKVYGHKFVDYDLETTTGGSLTITVKYYVTDCHLPVLSVGLTTSAGYEVHWTTSGATFGLPNHKVQLHNFDGLNYLVVDMSRRRRTLSAVLLRNPVTTLGRHMVIAVSKKSNKDY